jgi:hypothetical protein
VKLSIWGELSQCFVALWTAWCFLVTIWWKIKFVLRSFFAQSALFVLLIASSYVVLELAVASLRHVGAIPSEGRAGRLLTLLSEAPSLPMPIDAILLLIAALIVRHHWKEWKISRRQSAVPRVVEELLLEFDQFRKQAPITVDMRLEFIGRTFERFKMLLDTRSKRNVAMSLMDAASGQAGHLGVALFKPDDAEFDRALQLPVGAGGAGKAYKDGVPIYIPSVRHLVGINCDTLESLGITYRPGSNAESFSSLLSVPVLVGNSSVAVVVFASKQRSAFDPEDFEIASLAAALASMTY